MAKKIQMRRGTATDWTNFNPVLSSGELGYDITGKNFKIGDGTTAWNSLAYTFADIDDFNAFKDDLEGDFNDYTAALDTQFANFLSTNDAMFFKGTIGTGGTLEALPTTYSAGWTFKIVSEGTFAGQICEPGDIIIATVDREGTGNQDSDWVVVQENLFVKDFTNITIPTTGWSAGPAPFTRAITVTGIAELDSPVIDLDLSTVAFANIGAHIEAWALIYRAVTTANTITFYATAVPATQITLQAKVVR
jgi:hypothetical protein